MINIAFTVVSLLVLGIAVTVRGHFVPGSENTAEVLSEVTEETASPTPSEEPTATPESSSTPVASQSASPTAKPTSAPSINTGETLSAWLYPGVTVNSQDSTKASLTTHDLAKTVTDWYKDKIKAIGYRSTTTALTSSNDKVVNKLGAAKGESSVYIVITQESASAPVEIAIDLSKGGGSVNIQINNSN